MNDDVKSTKDTSKTKLERLAERKKEINKKIKKAKKEQKQKRYLEIGKFVEDKLGHEFSVGEIEDLKVMWNCFFAEGYNEGYKQGYSDLESAYQFVNQKGYVRKGEQ